MKIDRKSLFFMSLWLALASMMLVGYWTMRASRTRLQETQVQLRDCEKLAADIRALQNRPGFAALGVDSPRTITARAEVASEQAKIPATALVRIEPQAAVRLRDSPYRLRPTRLELRRVTLEQLVSFTHAMIDEAQGTTVRDIRLTAETSSQGVMNADLWSVELVLTQLIFAPLAR